MRKFLAFNILLIVTGLSVKAQGPKKVVADKIIAVVGDKIILQSDIENSISDMARQGSQLPDNADCMISEQAIISKVLMLQAEKDSLPVTDEEVEAELDQRIRYFIQQFGTQEQLELVAGKTIYQIKDEARESIKENKLATAMQRKIVENVKITPTEVKNYFDKIPKDSLPFYESELEVGQIVVYPKPSRDLEKYMMDELNNYKKQVENKTATFEQLAKRYSEDPGSKDRGGQYEFQRGDKTVDPAFLAAAFRLKDGEMSPVVKSKMGFHLILMEHRNGDNIIIRHILRIPPITQDEINIAVNKLDSVRSKIIAGVVGFNEAATRYSEDESAKYAGPFFMNRDGAPYVTIDQLDKEIVANLGKMKVGEYSQPIVYTDERTGKKGVRIIYLKSRSEPHRMNMLDDYDKIAQFAVEEKKAKVLEKWMKEKIPTYYIQVDNDVTQSCANLRKFVVEEPKAF
ncbi:MAG: peptidylprolyl isomerase [Bacteroidetes bacterium]|nr:peptidylprolyl isomerase [Bacteroidota bacterium]MBS1608074.1 peptidylprolyl isomerase [Bacteroidota bacterium]